MRFRLRTLLILLAVLPPLLAVGWWKYSAWKAEQERRAALSRTKLLAPLIIDIIDVVWVDDLADPRK
ncbi:MAG TPA: hypothetical protein VFB80_16280 [Pirellulaceae bacterium]|nr:hypothetical protein [Pirellulaceae bacterium]